MNRNLYLERDSAGQSYVELIVEEKRKKKKEKKEHRRAINGLRNRIRYWPVSHSTVVSWLRAMLKIHANWLKGSQRSCFKSKTPPIFPLNMDWVLVYTPSFIRVPHPSLKETRRLDRLVDCIDVLKNIAKRGCVYQNEWRQNSFSILFFHILQPYIYTYIHTI